MGKKGSLEKFKLYLDMKDIFLEEAIALQGNLSK